MCDGKLASKRDVVILSIKPKRPEFSSSQKYVPVSELLQEWDKLDAYYRGQLLKLTKSLTKTAKKDKDSKHHHQKHSRHHSPNNTKVNNKHSNQNSKSSSYPVNNKKHSSSLSSDQFTELFGDENLFSPAADTNNNNGNNRHSSHNHHNSSGKNNKLLLSRSLNSLFDDEEGLDDELLPAPPPPSRSRSISNSRKNSLSSVNGNLVVSIPVLSVQQPRDNYNSSNKNNKRLSKYFSDEDENESSGVSEQDSEEDDEPDNFLSVPRDNFQVQYGLKQKTRVALLETPGSVSPRFIVPIRVAPYKPPTAQGLNGVQIQKILYHKNDKVNYASPTTTTARTPDKPPDNSLASPMPASLTKSAKISSENNSPVSTVSPRSISSVSTITVTPPSSHSGDNNNATPKSAASQSPPDFASPKSDQGYKSSSSTSSSSSKLSSPPINSTTGNHHSRQQQKLKRPISLAENYSSSHSSSSSSSAGYGKKQRLGSSSSIDSVNSERSPSGYPFTPVTSSNYAFSSLSTASSYSSSTSSLPGDTFMESDNHHHHPHSPSRSRHSSTSSTTSSSSRFNATTDNATETSSNTKSSVSSGSPPASRDSKHKLNIINKNPSFVKPPSSSSSSSSSGDHSVFLAPAAVSITDRIIKKASRPQPELIERQRRRRMESNQRKSYALKMGDEHEEKESIDLSMKSFEMIWNVPLLSPLRSP